MINISNENPSSDNGQFMKDLDEKLDEEILNDNVEKLLTTLTSKQGEVLLMCMSHTHADIANDLGISSSRVGQLKQLGLKNLRKLSLDKLKSFL